MEGDTQRGEKAAKVCLDLATGELNMTDLESGRVDANRITKGACGRRGGPSLRLHAGRPGPRGTAG